MQRLDTINDIATTTAYNGKTLLDGTHAKKISAATETTQTTKMSQRIEPTGTPIIISAGDYTITDNGVYSLADGYTGTITVNAQNVKLTQETPATQLSNVSIVTASGGNVNLWIEGLNIKNTQNKNIIKFQGANNYLTVNGTNILDNSGKSRAAINVGDGLTIIGDGSLTTESYDGAGIGSDSGGTAGYIKIGGNLTITSTSYIGAAFGSGSYGSSIGEILIGGKATVIAKNTHMGTGIGSGLSHSSVGNISIGGNAKVTVTSSGEGIGSGYSDSTAGNISIGGNATVTVTSHNGVGIGSGGQHSSAGNILIGGNAKITATSNNSGAGIGSGSSSSNAGDILIGGNANVTAISNEEGAGIGSGKWNANVGNITISRSATINASSANADDIGAGTLSTVGTISIGQKNFDINVNVNIDGQDNLSDMNADTTSTTESIFNELRIHSGDSANHAMNIFIADMHTKSLGAGKLFDDSGNLINGSDINRYNALNYSNTKQAEWLTTLRVAENLTLDDISVTTRENANIAIRVIDGAIEYALDQATTVGSYLSRLEYTADNVTTSTDNVQAAESTIRDSDMAKAISGYTRYNVLTQAAQAMLAQANQNSNAVLGLLR